MFPLESLTPSPVQSRVLALTGAIGSGKSTVRKMFPDLGVPCLDIDLVARDIHQNPRQPATLAIASKIPASVDFDGKLRRGSLRELFAVDHEANFALKRILTPFVLEEAGRWTRT